MAASRPIKIGPILLIAALVFMGAWAARFNLRDNAIPRNFGVVDEGKVYRSGRLTPAATREIVQRHSVKTVIDFGAYQPGSVQERIAQQTAEALGVNRFRFSLHGDGTGDPMQYVYALRLMAKPELQPVLIHCAAGAQRTSACVMFYRDIYQGKPISETYEESFEFKHDDRRNPELRPYVQQWSERIKQAVKTGGEIEGKK
jgi:protein tyrosine/serine phosphatase